MKLTLATDAQKLQRDHLSYQAWGPPLTLEQYLEREQALRSHRYSRRAMQTWLLTQGEQVLASCETYRADARLDGRTGSCWAIASVFTEQQLRGRGYATELMNQLADRLASEPGALASTLYSDVGAALYERSGYRAQPAFDQVFSALPGPRPAALEVLDDSVEPSPPDSPAGLTITPRADQLDWHWERERLYARMLKRPGLPFHVLRAGDATLWVCAYLRTGELMALWLQAEHAAAAAPLVQCARALAAEAGLHQVRLWQTIDLSALTGALRQPREGSLPMVRAFCPGAERWLNIQRALWV